MGGLQEGLFGPYLAEMAVFGRIWAVFGRNGRIWRFGRIWAVFGGIRRNLVVIKLLSRPCSRMA